MWLLATGAVRMVMFIPVVPRIMSVALTALKTTLQQNARSQIKIRWYAVSAAQRVDAMITRSTRRAVLLLPRALQDCVQKQFMRMPRPLSLLPQHRKNHNGNILLI